MKLQNISKIFVCSALALAVSTGCNKKLELSPRQSIDAATAIQTAADLEGVVVGMYSVMGGGALYGTNLLLVPETQASYFPNTEQYASWRGTFTGHQQIGRKTMNRNNGEASRMWTAGYLAINTANIVLENLNVVDDADLKSQFEGEALFVRGIMHFELVRFFGLPWGATPTNNTLGVVIKTTAANTETEAAEKLPRATVAQVYAQVITDLTAAAAKLPEDNGTRADRYTALAFLAKVYLQQGDYANARDAANAVIESGKYSMNASVRAVFDNKNTNESIFEIQQNDQNNAGTANDGMATFFASLPGIGRGDVRVAPAFVNSYDPDDLRAVEWYYIGTGARPGNVYTSKWKSFSQNLPVVRIAEMYLIRAETNIRLGGAPLGPSPASDLAQVRNPIRTNLAVIANPTLNDVLQERIYELAFEGFRIHEIKRLKQSFSDYTWNDDILVFPIPQIEIDATEGVLVQNPGY
jgi:starch-binding outer membrane protein, SusD/RagB family